jgi:hypothetical protein
VIHPGVDGHNAVKNARLRIAVETDENLGKGHYTAGSEGKEIARG